MNRTLIALCAAAVMTALGMGATPAAAFVDDFNLSFSNRGGSDRVASRAERRSARSTRTASPRRKANRSAALPSLTGSRGSGIASYYWQPQRVASGGWFNPNAMTAAHRTLPFGTRVRVTNLGNGRAVTVTINDRGPYIAGRVIDLSRAAARVVGMTGSGLARVTVAVLGRG